MLENIVDGWFKRFVIDKDLRLKTAMFLSLGLGAVAAVAWWLDMLVWPLVWAWKKWGKK